MDTRQQAIEDLGRKIAAFEVFVWSLHKEYYGNLDRPDSQMQAVRDKDHGIIHTRQDEKRPCNCDV